MEFVNVLTVSLALKALIKAISKKEEWMGLEN